MGLGLARLCPLLAWPVLAVVRSGEARPRARRLGEMRSWAVLVVRVSLPPRHSDDVRCSIRSWVGLRGDSPCCSPSLQKGWYRQRRGPGGASSGSTRPRGHTTMASADLLVEGGTPRGGDALGGGGRALSAFPAALPSAFAVQASVPRSQSEGPNCASVSRGKRGFMNIMNRALVLAAAVLCRVRMGCVPGRRSKCVQLCCCYAYPLAAVWSIQDGGTNNMPFGQPCRYVYNAAYVMMCLVPVR